jgi:hypothetical protein
MTDITLPEITVYPDPDLPAIGSPIGNPNSASAAGNYNINTPGQSGEFSQPGINDLNEMFDAGLAGGTSSTPADVTQAGSTGSGSASATAASAGDLGSLFSGIENFGLRVFVVILAIVLVGVALWFLMGRT